MSTENDQLQEEAKKQFVRQRVEEVRVYMNKLFADIDRAWDLHCRDQILLSSMFGTTVVAQISVAFFPGMWAETNRTIANVLLWVVVGRSWLYVVPAFIGCRDEIRGCIKTLEILGMIEGSDGGNKQLKKYKESVMAKMWEVLKQKARSSAYQQA